jgi:hypothetical protein
VTSNVGPMPATALRMVTDEEIASFHRDGAVLIKQVLPAEWVQLAAAGLDAAIAEPDVMSAELANGTLRVDQFPAAKSNQLRRLVDESPIAEIVGRALQSPVTFYMDQMFHKLPGLVAPTPWHQDTCYYNLDGHDLIRAWVSPDPVARNVSLEVVAMPPPTSQRVINSNRPPMMRRCLGEMSTKHGPTPAVYAINRFRLCQTSTRTETPSTSLDGSTNLATSSCSTGMCCTRLLAMLSASEPGVPTRRCGQAAMCVTCIVPARSFLTRLVCMTMNLRPGSR